MNSNASKANMTVTPSQRLSTPPICAPIASTLNATTSFNSTNDCEPNEICSDRNLGLKKSAAAEVHTAEVNSSMVALADILNQC